MITRGSILTLFWDIFWLLIGHSLYRSVVGLCPGFFSLCILLASGGVLIAFLGCGIGRGADSSQITLKGWASRFEFAQRTISANQIQLDDHVIDLTSKEGRRLEWPGASREYLNNTTHELIRILPLDEPNKESRSTSPRAHQRTTHDKNPKYRIENRENIESYQWVTQKS